MSNRRLLVHNDQPRAGPPTLSVPVALDALVIVAIFVALLAGSFEFHGVPIRYAGVVVVLFLSVLSALTPMTPNGTNAPFFLLLLWLGAIALSSAWAPTGARTAEILTDILILALLMTCLFLVAGRIPRATLNMVLWITLFAGTVYAFSGLAMGTVDQQGRLAVFGGGPNVYVRVVGAAMVAALALALAGQRWYLLLLMPVLGAAAIMSGSRGGVLAVAVALLLLAFRALRSKSARMRRIVLGSVAIGAITGYLVVWPRVSQYVERRFVDETLQARYSSGRTSIYSDSLRMFLDQPLAGAGLDSYHATVGAISGFEYPHNIVLATAAETGIVGLLPLVPLIALAAWLAVARGDLAATALGAIAVLYLMSSMFSGYWYDSRFVWFYLLLAASAGAKRPADDLYVETRPVQGGAPRSPTDRA